MKLIILCVDGFDPDYAHENGHANMRYQKKLEIPRECYVDTQEGPVPHTVKVWPTIFSGKIMGQYTTKPRGPLRKTLHNLLIKTGITWSGPPAYRVNPSNQCLDTFLENRLSFHWNLPTISPEWISSFPSLDKLMQFGMREYTHFLMLTRALPSTPYDLSAIYTRILDLWGHYRHESIDPFYKEITTEAQYLASKGLDVILLSDHGCIKGVHTHHAYFGATFPIKANSVTEVRNDVERYFQTSIPNLQSVSEKEGIAT